MSGGECCFFPVLIFHECGFWTKGAIAHQTIRRFTTLIEAALTSHCGRVEDDCVKCCINGVEANRFIHSQTEAKLNVVRINRTPHEFSLSLLYHVFAAFADQRKTRSNNTTFNPPFKMASLHKSTWSFQIRKYHIWKYTTYLLP